MTVPPLPYTGQYANDPAADSVQAAFNKTNAYLLYLGAPQSGTSILVAVNTTAPTRLTTDGGPVQASGINSIPVPMNSAVLVSGRYLARNLATNNTVTYDWSVRLRRDAGNVYIPSGSSVRIAAFDPPEGEMSGASVPVFSADASRNCLSVVSASLGGATLSHQVTFAVVQV